MSSIVVQQTQQPPIDDSPEGIIDRLVEMGYGGKFALYGTKIRMPGGLVTDTAIYPTGYCPLQKLTGYAVGYRDEARRMGYSIDTIEEIMWAADFIPVGYPKLRGLRKLMIEKLCK